MKTPEQITVAKAAAQSVIDANDLEQEDGENPLAALGWAMGGQMEYEDALIQFAAAAIEADRAQRGIIAQVAEVLDDRGATAAAQLVRDTDPDDDLWNNYIGPMLDSIEDDYTGMAKEINA